MKVNLIGPGRGLRIGPTLRLLKSLLRVPVSGLQKERRQQHASLDEAYLLNGIEPWRANDITPNQAFIKAFWGKG